MKKYLFHLVTLVSFAVSCQSRLPDIDSRRATAPDITAEAQPATKTLITVDGEGEGTIYWKPADEINVFYGTTGTRYVSQNTENATTAVFRTTDVIGNTESASTNIWGLYPYDANAVCNGSAITTTLPAVQYGVPETFDDDLFITLAHSNNTNLKFFNVCGGIKFSLSRDDITSITFKGNADEDIAGDISVTFADGVPEATVVNGQKRITLRPKTGSTFARNVNYYFVVLPGALSQGFTMTFTTTGGAVGVFHYTAQPVSIKRSVFSRKAAIDTYATFQRAVSKVIFLGNSITLHPICGYWWGTWGMAATRRENDYVHRVMARLQEFVPSATYSTPGIAYDNKFWELDFSVNVAAALANVLTNDIDLVVIRLGENVTDTAHFESALVNLVNYISSVATQARIIITGQFWTNQVKETACIQAAATTGATYVRIDQFDTAAYKERVGNSVFGDDYQWHQIDNAAVAEHPSDAGMQAIANAILDGLFSYAF